jgi:hypothetical protein
LTKVSRKGLDYNWAITTPCPGAISTFRPVEMYRANFNHIVTHHVGMVSGAYTAVFGGPPKFVVSARLACAMDQLATPNYYYFASRKVAPQSIVLKYKARGFGLDAFPAGIKEAMSVVMGQDKYWSGCVNDAYSNGHFDYPAINATGNFSAYALGAELRAEKL